MDPLFLIAAAVGILARLLVVWALRPWREERPDRGSPEEVSGGEKEPLPPPRGRKDGEEEDLEAL